MKQSQHLLDNAVTCSKLAKRTTDRQMKTHFKRMEEAWRALAREQDWLDGEITPVDVSRLGRRPRIGHSAPLIPSERS
ncbi:hypothetical protein [Bradyrhizobium sp. Ai1a-2]|uniref:hypothetical protein n=1 Tax=Bradyrhizobium sp. Ai1a-2 TaxID=196490 RepID=UPI0005BD28BE|nr:hypothetical protein [Bradyrhizobium sp. Ai1a-2]